MPEQFNPAQKRFINQFNQKLDPDAEPVAEPSAAASPQPRTWKDIAEGISQPQAAPPSALRGTFVEPLAGAEAAPAPGPSPGASGGNGEIGTAGILLDMAKRKLLGGGAPSSSDQ